MKSKMKLTLVVLISFVAIGFSLTINGSARIRKQETSLYKIVYEADRDGNRLKGSLDELLEYVHHGNPVRVGWELPIKWPDTTVYLRHWTDAGFISTLRGQVFAQIPAIFGQGFAHIDGPPGIFLNPDKIPDSWVAVIGTDGTMRSKFHVGEEMKDFPEEAIKGMETSKVKTFWSVMVKRE